MFIISRWGELLREPKKPLTKEQLKKKRGQSKQPLHTWEDVQAGERSCRR